MRDLGLAELPRDWTFRTCLMCQDADHPNAGLARCIPPDPFAGRHCIPPEWDDGVGCPCPRFLLPDAVREERDSGAVLRVYCGTLGCPIDR